jgi:hypothetical protein
MKIVDKEARSGFPRIRGARLSATVPISQEVMDRMLRKLPLRVEIQEQNRIFVSYGVIRAAAQIVRVTPELTVVLSASWLSRTALRGVLAWKPGLQRYIAAQDGFVYILCSQIPRIARYRYWWQHLSEIQARTVPGQLVLDIRAHIQ